MKILSKLLFLQILLLPAFTYADNLKPGDVILIELRCYSCPIIADETESRFSHSGVYLGLVNNQPQVAQALGPVHMTSLDSFLSKRVKNSKALVLRPSVEMNTSDLVTEFNRHWRGIPFDSNYTWDDEKLYCSEFVAKFLETFLGAVLPPQPLDFSRNWDFWNRVMNPVPQGELGNSPGDLERSSQFIHVGEID